MRARRIGGLVLVIVLALLGVGGPAAGQATTTSTTIATSVVPVSPSVSEPIQPGPHLATDAEEDGAPAFLIAGVVVSALATFVILVFFLRSRRSGSG